MFITSCLISLLLIKKKNSISNIPYNIHLLFSYSLSRWMLQINIQNKNTKNLRASIVCLYFFVNKSNFHCIEKLCYKFVSFRSLMPLRIMNCPKNIPLKEYLFLVLKYTWNYFYLDSPLGEWSALWRRYMVSHHRMQDIFSRHIYFLLIYYIIQHHTEVQTFNN